jgi:copper amine oxidase-like protein
VRPRNTVLLGEPPPPAVTDSRPPQVVSMRPINRPLLSLTLLLVLAAPVRATAPSIVIDGSALPGDVPALVSGDHVLVPLRGVFERLGATVSYDATSQTAIAALNDTRVSVTVGSTTALVNGKPRTLDVSPREVAGRVMIPLRFVAQSLGVSVDYDDTSDTVVIVTGLRPGNFAAMTSGPSLPAAPKQAPTVEDARPSSGSLIGSPYPSIYARFNGGSSAVDPASVRITVDGEDVTGSSTVSSAYVSYTPAAPLMTGQHTVSVTGAADDGTQFSEGWTFRVDEGTTSDYTTQTYGGGAGYYDGGYGGYGGLDGFGWPLHGHRHFGFFPPGFSVFTPGPLYFVQGGIIEVIFVSQFFPFGNAFFTISGFPGSFPLTPWLGNPGFFWGYARVPSGVTAHNAIIAARFTTPAGQKVVVRSTAPLQIEGTRHSLPADLRYAVLPHLINRPSSPRHVVAFERFPQATYTDIRPTVRGVKPPENAAFGGHPAPVVTHPGLGAAHPAPVLAHPAPIVIRPAPIAVHPMPHPQPIGVMPIERFPLTQWQFMGPVHPMMPGVPAKPK